MHKHVSLRKPIEAITTVARAATEFSHEQVSFDHVTKCLSLAHSISFRFWWRHNNFGSAG